MEYFVYAKKHDADQLLEIAKSTFAEFRSNPFWLTVVMVGVEYLDIIPSVKAITAKSSGTFMPILLAILIMVTANN